MRFENKLQFVPLQAADILAYELNRWHKSYHKLDHKKLRRPIINALAEVPRNWGRLDLEQMKLMGEIATLKTFWESHEVDL